MKERSHKEISKLGGNTTYKRHGRNHMSKIGKLGSSKRWDGKRKNEMERQEVQKM